MVRLRACLALLVGLVLGPGTMAQDGGSAAMLDTLFAKLQTATDPMAIQSLEAAIWEQWILGPDGPKRELMMRGIAEMQQCRKFYGELRTVGFGSEVRPGKQSLKRLV